MCRFEGEHYDELFCDICYKLTVEPKLLKCCSEVSKLLIRNYVAAQEAIAQCRLMLIISKVGGGTVSEANKDRYLVRCEPCHDMTKDKDDYVLRYDMWVNEQRREQRRQQEAAMLDAIQPSNESAEVEDTMPESAPTQLPVIDLDQAATSNGLSTESSIPDTTIHEAPKRLAPIKTTRKHWNDQNWRRRH